MDRIIHLHWLDWSIVIIYLGALLVLGFVQSRRGARNTKEYFQAGKAMRWLMIGISMLAGTTSATDFISQPSNTIQYAYIPLVTMFSFIFIYPYIFYVALPFYRRLGIVSIYEYIEQRFDGRVRTLTAGVFIASMTLVVGLSIFVPAKAIVSVLGKDEWLRPLIIGFGIIATLFTTLTGMRGVIWGGVLMSFILFAALASEIFFLLFKIKGGMGAIIDNTFNVGIYIKDSNLSGLDWASFKEYIRLPYTCIGLLLIGLLGGISTYSCNQGVVQRLSSTHSVRDAQRGFFMSVLGNMIAGLALAFIGVGLFTYYSQVGGGTLPAALQADPDKIVPWFIADVFPIGFAGLIIAAVLSLGLGGYAGQLNSLSTVTMIDFLNRVIPSFRDGDPSQAEYQHTQVRWSKALTLAFGVIAILIAVYAGRLGKIIDIAMSLAFTFSAPVMGIFLCAMFWRRATGRGVFWAGLISSLAGVYLMISTAPAMYSAGGPFHFLAALMPAAPAPGQPAYLSRQWILPLGMIAFMIPAVIISLLSPAEPAKAALTWYEVRKRKLDVEGDTVEEKGAEEEKVLEKI